MFGLTWFRPIWNETTAMEDDLVIAVFQGPSRGVRKHIAILINEGIWMVNLLLY
jgi:hypothetical protein